MGISPVFNISLLQLIKNHDGLTISDIRKQDEFKTMGLTILESELEILLSMNEINLTEDKKYI